jgi:CHASE1-domain containing sensor protein
MVVEERSKHQHVGEVHPPRFRLHLPWVILILGVTLSIFAYFSVRSWEEGVVRTSFSILSAGHAASVNLELTRHLDASDALLGLYDVSQRVDRQQFDRFGVTILARHNDIQALMWVPRVKPTERSSLIEQAEQDGLKDFRIHDVNGRDASGPVTPQADYFPILYVQPMQENSNLLGIDLMANPTYRGLLETARDTGHVEFSAPVQANLKVKESLGNCILLVQAIYQKGANLETMAGRREGLEGFILQLFRIDDLIAEALSESAVLGLDISVVYGGNSHELQRKNYHSSVPPEGQDIVSSPHNVTRSTSALKLRVRMDYLGKSWALVFTPTPRFWSNYQPWTSLVVLAAGVLISLLLAISSLMLSRRSIRT